MNGTQTLPAGEYIDVLIPLDEYEEVREDPTTFLLNPDHVEQDVEQVIRHRRGYAIVQKVNRVVARIVRQLDPRTKPV